MSRNCQQCGEPVSSKGRYCSVRCKQRAYRKRCTANGPSVAAVEPDAIEANDEAQQPPNPTPEPSKPAHRIIFYGNRWRIKRPDGRMYGTWVFGSREAAECFMLEYGLQ